MEKKNWLYQCATNDGRESELIKASSPIDAARKFTGINTLRKAERKGQKVFWNVIVYKFDSKNTNVAVDEYLYVWR